MTHHNCDIEKVYQFADGELSGHDMERVEGHLGECAHCRLALRQSRQTDNTLSTVWPNAGASTFPPGHDSQNHKPDAPRYAPMAPAYPTHLSQMGGDTPGHGGTAAGPVATLAFNRKRKRTQRHHHFTDQRQRVDYDV